MRVKRKKRKNENNTDYFNKKKIQISHLPSKIFVLFPVLIMIIIDGPWMN
jgi:hypothetical protein